MSLHLLLQAIICFSVPRGEFSRQLLRHTLRAKQNPGTFARGLDRTLVRDYASMAFRFRPQPSRPNAPRPVAKSGRAAGSGTAGSGTSDTEEVTQPLQYISVVPSKIAAVLMGEMALVPQPDVTNWRRKLASCPSGKYQTDDCAIEISERVQVREPVTQSSPIKAVPSVFVVSMVTWPLRLGSWASPDAGWVATRKLPWTECRAVRREIDDHRVCRCSQNC